MIKIYRLSFFFALHYLKEDNDFVVLNTCVRVF